MEKTARKPSADPAQERLRQNKANWNKDVSAFVNDLIHFKKMMNGWPSKFFKERSRIGDPIPADPATIIGSLAGDFQELAQRGNAIVAEQINYAKNRRKRQPKQLNLPLQQPEQTAPAIPEAPKPPAPDLSKQLSLGLNASDDSSDLFKFASEMEGKYFLESEASNPVTRFIARLFNPKFGFGEAARMRRLRMTMLNDAANTFKVLKNLQAVIVKSSDSSVEEAHKMMTRAWNHWNIVYRLFDTYKTMSPADPKDVGGQIVDPELQRQEAGEDGGPGGHEDNPPTRPSSVNTTLISKLKDFRQNSAFIGSVVHNAEFQALSSLVERAIALPKSTPLTSEMSAELESAYDAALAACAKELGISNATSFGSLAQAAISVANKKEAQEIRSFFGKTRHQLLPGGTSGQRLEIYNLVVQTKDDVNKLMDLLEKGFDRQKIAAQITQIHREMSRLRIALRSLFYSLKPEKASSPFF